MIFYVEVHILTSHSDVLCPIIYIYIHLFQILGIYYCNGNLITEPNRMIPLSSTLLSYLGIVL